jgi:hypothetical protein
MDDQTKALGAAGGAVGFGGTAALLNLCCAPTWAMSLLGAGTGIWLAQYNFLQPYLAGGAVTLCALLFWLAYRPAKAGEAYTQAQARRFRLRTLAWVTIGVLAVFLAVALLAPLETGR